MGYFDEFEFNDFWFHGDTNSEITISENAIETAEKELGYTLPASYKEFIKKHNGGYVNRNSFPTKIRTSWSENHIMISNIMGIGGENDIVNETKLMVDEWEYPNIGVVVCDCPSAGHDVVMLDYRECGNRGEPKVVHVDQEWDYSITLLSEDFEHFIKGLVYEEESE